MKRVRLAWALALLFVVSGSPAAEAAPFFASCFQLDNNPSYTLYLNYVVQGNAILVSGRRGEVVEDDHGPVTGTLIPLLLGNPPIWEMGLTVMYGNQGDYAGPNLETVVLRFFNGTISYKKWTTGSTTFTQGTASACTPR